MPLMSGVHPGTECPSCASPVPAGKVACPSCGASVDTASPSGPTDTVSADALGKVDRIADDMTQLVHDLLKVVRGAQKIGRGVSDISKSGSKFTDPDSSPKVRAPVPKSSRAAQRPKNGARVDSKATAGGDKSDLMPSSQRARTAAGTAPNAPKRGAVRSKPNVRSSTRR
jgi:hypothetical protein